MFAKFAIILLSLYLASATKHETVTKSFQFPNKKLVLAEPSFNDKSLVYALCAQSSKQCTIVQEINPFVKTPITKKCELTLQVDDVQLIVSAGKDKAILITQELKGKSIMLKAITVHLANCKTAEEELFEIPSNWKGIQLYRKNIDVVVFENGFEIVIKGLSQICSTADKKLYCGFIFDAEGKKLEGPIIWPKLKYTDISIGSPIMADVQGNGYFFVNEEDSLIGIKADRQASDTYTKLWGPQKLYADHWTGGYSTANTVIGMCYAENSTIRCWQNDPQGGVLMNAEVDFKHQHKIAHLYVHNLPNREWLLLMITCPDRVCSGTEDHYYLMKLDAQGKLSKHIDINIKSNCNAKNGKIMAKVFENEEGLYCTARLCKNLPTDEAKFEATIDCYTDDHFKQ
ncbi:uncharacterized protein LOC131669899 [Phymastichus coffea]|uniref:uncharacterized protein LOC131669899 n=1 Tax=Phymastichus coffea TaxID=108790 RepID=UPI00273B7E6B|nr:uncharacterized protein LOC131669899 [Phymastichus coffea]